MKITAIKLHTLEHPTLTQAGYRLKQTSGLRRIQYTHIPLSTTTPMQMQILDVETDEGITGRIAPASITKCQLDILKTHAVGESPFARERLLSDVAPKARAGSTRIPAGSATSTTAFGTSLAKPPACPSTPSPAACATACPSISPTTS